MPKFSILITPVLIILIILSSCGKKRLKQGEESLVGVWKVFEIYSGFGTKGENGGTGIATNKTETGDLGLFQFTENNLMFEYTRLDTLYDGSSTWSLSFKKQKSGFSKETIYSLKTDSLTYVCQFGDETKKATKNADVIRLVYETTEVGPYTNIILQLKKE